MRRLILLSLVVIGGCHRPPDPAVIASDERCSRLEAARKSSTAVEVPVSGVTFLASADEQGGATFFDIACGYRLYRLAYDKRASGYAVARRIEDTRKAGSSGKFYLIADGNMIFPGNAAYTIRISRIRALSPVPNDQVAALLEDLKERHRVLPDKLDF